MKENISMSVAEINQIEILEKLLRKEIKQKRASQILGLSVRQIQRKLHRYKLHGTKSLAHKSRGRVSNNKVKQVVLDQAINLIKAKYVDFAPTLACEKLSENHQLKLSVERLRQEMAKVGLWKVHTRKRASYHGLRERRACSGELIQIDGSPHDWFEGRAPRCNLSAIIDDATGRIMLSFSKVETAKDYFKLLKQYFKKYGLPLAIYSDRHSIFKVSTPSNLDYKLPIKDKENSEHIGLTQFGRAMKELGIELIFANSPQAKGRVERLNQTLQDRLVKELRLKNISSIDEANAFCEEFCKGFDLRFTEEPRSGVNMHRKINKRIDLESILCLKEQRILSKNLTLQYENKIYQIKTDKANCSYRLRRSTVTVCDLCDENIVIKDHQGNKLDYYTLKKLVKNKATSSKELNAELDLLINNKTQKKAQYPWERQLSLT